MSRRAKPKTRPSNLLNRARDWLRESRQHQLLAGVSLGAIAVVVAIATVLAVADGGPSGPACLTGTATVPPTPTPVAGLTLKVGSYEGTGSPQCIRGVGFQPVLVIIKGDTGEFAVWRSSSMKGDSTADFASGQLNIESAIASLDADAFSLGKDETVNAEGVTYYYVAFADSPEIKVGSYVGNGREGRSIRGVGFQPALVFLKWDGPRSAVWRSLSHEEGVSSFFDAQGDRTGFIGSLVPDGFEVGSDSWVNNAGGADDPSTYHYVAFKGVPGRITTGSYVGDGSGSREVTGIGFQPDYVWVKRDSDKNKAVHRPSSLPEDSTLRFEAVANAADEITALLPDGFQVGSESSVNAEGDTFNYVAWKSSSGP